MSTAPRADTPVRATGSAASPAGRHSASTPAPRAERSAGETGDSSSSSRPRLQPQVAANKSTVANMAHAARKHLVNRVLSPMNIPVPP